MQVMLKCTLANIFKVNSIARQHLNFSNKSCSKGTQKMVDTDLTFSIMSKQLAPPLTRERHKGQAGRIGVFGGCLEYTGAPYFAAISALKVGADLAHVFCMREAAPVIKSYSPELIVHPYLDDSDAIKKIEPWMERLHVIVIGPGLGRDSNIFKTIGDIINLCKSKQKPLIIDADGLFYVTKNLDILKDYPEPGVILTPNVVEYSRLVGVDIVNESNRNSSSKKVFDLTPFVTILKKGHEDEIFDNAKTISVVGGGSGRRCGGQGDLLAGSLATFWAWALQHKRDSENIHDDRTMIACYAACRLTRHCNAAAFARKGRSMTCTDMIDEIGDVFNKYFEST